MEEEDDEDERETFFREREVGPVDERERGNTTVRNSSAKRQGQKREFADGSRWLDKAGK